MDNKISHPEHYTCQTLTLEPIQLLDGLPFCVGNVIKYILRREHKDTEIENWQKAKEYFEDTYQYLTLEILVELQIWRFSKDSVVSKLGWDLYHGRTYEEKEDVWANFGMTIESNIRRLEMQTKEWQRSVQEKVIERSKELQNESTSN